MQAADIVVASTSSPHHVIERDALAEVIASRDGRPLLLIDLAVPRDIHPAAASSPASASTTWTTCRPSWSATPAAARRRPAAPSADTRRAEPLRALARHPGRPADARGAAGARRRGGRALLAENERALGILTDADRERARGAGRRDRLPPASRADPEAEARDRRGLASSTSTPFASCSASTPRTRRSPTPTRRCARPATSAAAATPRGSGPGGPGFASATRGSTLP